MASLLKLQVLDGELIGLHPYGLLAGSAVKELHVGGCQFDADEHNADEEDTYAT